MQKWSTIWELNLANWETYNNIRWGLDDVSSTIVAFPNDPPNPLREADNRSQQPKQDNRSIHTQRDTDKIKNFTITLKNIDETILQQLEKMSIHVVDNGNNIKVPISYASPEKWKSIRKDGFMRDNNGRIILPAIIFYRQSSEVDKSMMTFNKYLKYPIIKTYSIKNQYTKFSTLIGKNIPINEVYNITMPDHMVFTYKFIVWTEYIEQMNSIIEKINFETHDYWGTKTGFRFRTSIDSYMHTQEVENEKDRLVKTEFDLILRGYLLPELFSIGLDSFKSTTEKLFTPKKVIFGMETVATNWEPAINKTEKDKWKSQTFPNLQKGTEPPSPPTSFQNENSIPSITTS